MRETQSQTQDNQRIVTIRQHTKIIREDIMAKKKAYMLPNVMTPNRPVLFTDKCKGCNLCLEICPEDVYVPNSEKGKPPIILVSAGTADAA